MRSGPENTTTVTLRRHACPGWARRVLIGKNAEKPVVTEILRFETLLTLLVIFGKCQKETNIGTKL